MNNPQISVVVPVYNREDCINKCIESVIPQLSDNYELIIVNDGSTDETSQIINSYKKKSNFIKIIDYSDNKGVNYARNRGVEAAQGKYILFLDSDDYLTSSCLDHMALTIQKSSDFKHYLFLVDDFVGLRPQEERVYTYVDWLSNSVSGDFAHVVYRETLLMYPFDENFRLYESLIWLKIFKSNQDQLYVPFIVINRDRSRNDSLSKEYLLQSRKNMAQDYDYVHKFITYYYEDMVVNNLQGQLIKQIKKAIIIGIAINRIEENKKLFATLKSLNFSKVRILKMLNCSVFSPFIFIMIKNYSKLKNA